ncbi:MAG: permease-like cell division protein FtsX [bacterium]|nr:permease-like cell division protein FtsX [bacterium]
MRFSTFWYCLKQGVKNICRNMLFSLASIATVSACIFLFCMFFAIIANVGHVVDNVESTVGITVFFEDGLGEEKIHEIQEMISQREEVREVTYTSAEEAWEKFQKDYFKGMEELAEGFQDDNPLANSASLEVFLHEIESQAEIVSYLEGIEGVRKVSYSNDVASGLSSFNRLLGIVSMLIIGVLLVVAIFLISNTISVAASFRKQENQIMKLIGATNYMIRAPFVVEGLLIGTIGALLPLAAMVYLYQKGVQFFMEKFYGLSGLITFLPFSEIYPVMAGVALALGMGIGFFVSFFTIQKHLKV